VKSSNSKGNGIGKGPLKEPAGARAPSPGRVAKGDGVKKVAVLRTAIDRGEYRVPAKKVADKIVKDAVRDIRSRLR
jgi:hypothetical protein